MNKIQEYRVGSSDWDADELVRRRAEIVDLYQVVFVPALGFALTNVLLYTFVVALLYSALQLSGIGFDEARELILRATGNAPWATSTIGRLSSSTGNIALALLVAELAGPLLIVATVPLSPKVTEAVRSLLKARGLDAEGASAKLEEMIKLMGGQ